MESETLTKYKAAGDIVHKVIQKLVPLCVEGANVLALCLEGDKAIEEGLGAVYSKAVKGVKVTKGVAFPTCISLNNCVAHFSPLASDPVASAVKLSDGDVVKIQLGAHIDGFASVSAETLIVGATAESPATGKKADVVKAAWTAAEAAMRLIKVGEKNYAVTDAVAKVVSEFDTTAVEGMLSCQQVQGAIEGKKKIILNPTPEQRRSTEVATFAEGEVYGMDILVSSGDGKTRLEDTKVTVYLPQPEVTYQLKMKSSRTVFSEIKRKAGSFPFNLRILDDEKRAPLGILEPVQHGLLRPLEVVYTPADTFVATFHFTIALLAGGPALLTHPPVWYSTDKLKTEKELQDETIKELLTKKLRDGKKKKTKKAAAADGEEKEEKAEEVEEKE
ncbi:proliferation-associated protein 1 [Calocera viscosa TUFC12733]|uniref:Proliferation-associated protein 1 n=1 Tax=Calocera viscosa (strain TUFC12733) TaxID=1330018 RepID=A0A167R5B7_CALVF|nr:proliferation-associated protein 1 [Calocera viscosa TUFC12733]